MAYPINPSVLKENFDDSLKYDLLNVCEIVYVRYLMYYVTHVFVYEKEIGSPICRRKK